MSYPALTLPQGVGIDVGTAYSKKPRIRRANFGDGYSQRSGDGLNAIGIKLEVRFTNLTTAEAQAIEGFLTERKGYLPFMFQLPDETSPRQWIATEWSYNYASPKTRNLVVQLEETFDP